MEYAGENVDFLSRPKAERHLIVVLSDDEIKAQQKYIEEQEDSGFVKTAKSLSRFILPTQLIIVEASIEIYKGIMKLREQGIKTVSVSQSDVKEINFPPAIQGSAFCT